MRQFFVAGFLGLSLILLPGLSQAEPMKGEPIAQQIDGLGQLLSVAMIPVEILGAMTYAEGESYVEGRMYEGDYARHGFVRTHARWWDPFFYYHEK